MFVYQNVPDEPQYFKSKAKALVAGVNNKEWAAIEVAWRCSWLFLFYPEPQWPAMKGETKASTLISGVLQRNTFLHKTQVLGYTIIHGVPSHIQKKDSQDELTKITSWITRKGGNKGRRICMLILPNRLPVVLSGYAGLSLMFIDANWGVSFTESNEVCSGFRGINKGEVLKLANQTW